MMLSIILSIILWAGVPPVELANHVIWGWNGEMTHETMCHDLDSMKLKGFNSVIFEAGYHLPYEYLSEDWFKAIRTAVMEAKARGMKVWIIDEGKYPSGFAGGKFTREKPELRMKALVVKDTIHVNGGAVLRDLAVSSAVISAVAVSNSGELDRQIAVKNGKINFCAGSGSWDILLIGPDFRTGQTRAVNNPTGGKDTKNSQCDYLNPLAVRQFLDWTHEQYKKYIGDEFGKTFLGFRGDEPDFSYLPWTDKMVSEFMEIKGYDPTDYLGTLLGKNPDANARKFKADYWDVWSVLFSVNFFKQQSDWCAENGISYITHLNKDHDMTECIRVSGELFRDLKYVQVPGVDAIWNQIWPGVVNDFPKYASSVSHVYGKRRAFSESFAAYRTPPTIPTAKYALDYQMTRGINFFELMFWSAGSKHETWMSDPRMKELNGYLNRATYMLSQGIPGARIAVFWPSSSIWLGNKTVSDDLTEISGQLLAHQKDFDWIGDDAFSDALSVKTGYLENLSGQKYYTLIIPSCEMLSEQAWAKIEEFSKRGGKVLFWGRKPHSVYGKTFFCTRTLPVLEKNCFEEPAVKWTGTVNAAMPESEISLDNFTPEVSYTKRQLEDGELFFIFNEGEKPASFSAKFDACGIVREWNCADGSCKPIDAEKKGASTVLSMTLAPWESRMISIVRGKGEYNVKKLGVKSSDTPQTAAIQAVIDKAYADGGGTVVFPAGKYLTGALFFPSGVNLSLKKNAVLTGTATPDDYPVISTRFEGIDRQWRCALLNFDHSKGVRVDGEGTVDGNGLEWNKVKAAGGRPRLMCFTDCDGGSISGLKLRNQASWCLHVLYTEGFDINGLDITAKEYIPSSDGIDIDSSSDVHVSDCYVSVHDDCISIKSGKDEEGRRVGKPSEDILIEDCHFGYGHGAVTMGSEVSGDIRNVTVRNCLVDEDNWAPIRFKSQPSRGGVVENICFENIEVKDVRNIFDIILEWKAGSDKRRQIEPYKPLTCLRNITIRNVHGSGKSMGQFVGFDGEPIRPETFRFENCSFRTTSGLKIKNAFIVPEGLDFEVAEGRKFIAPGARRPDPAAQAKEIIERIYNYLNSCTPFTMANAEGADVSPDNATADCRFKRGEFLINTYEWGVTYSGLLLAGQLLSEPKYLDYVYDRLGAIGAVYDRLEPLHAKGDDVKMKYLVAPHWLDDCGSMCAAMSKATIMDPSRSKKFRKVLERWYKFCMYEEYRLDDGILARHRPVENSVWLDDMYMGITPIAFRGALAASENDSSCSGMYEESIKQVKLFGKYLWVPEKNLYRHGWIEGMAEHPDYHWARCNGWALLTMCDVLDAVPEGTPGRDEVLEQFRSLARGITALQAPDGRWHQLLNVNESYLETSATAIFVYCIAHAVNEGWLDRIAYQDVARAGWNGLLSQVNEKGQVENTCVGTGLGWTNAFYSKRPVDVHAAHGYGPVILAAAEIIRLQKSLKK